MKSRNPKRPLDALDAHLLRLLNQRVALAHALTPKKSRAVADAHAETARLSRLQKKCRGSLTPSALHAIYREIFSASRASQQPMAIAYLGPEGTYSHQAAVEHFGRADHYLPCHSIPEVFAAVSREEAQVGIVPVENSIEGGVNAALDCLVHTDLLICGERYLKIRHVLAVSSKNRGIEKIYSHPQPLGQCRQWLLTHYPKIPQIEVASTSEAARRASADARAAAIASPWGAKLHHLRVLARNIADIPSNITRFLLLASAPARRAKHHKTGLVFAVAHQVGALNAVLNIFAAHRLNLQKIESRPAPHKAWEYLFFVDVSGHHQDLHFARALSQIRKKTLWIKILGSYPQHHHA